MITFYVDKLLLWKLRKSHTLFIIKSNVSVTSQLGVSVLVWGVSGGCEAATRLTSAGCDPLRSGQGRESLQIRAKQNKAALAAQPGPSWAEWGQPGHCGHLPRLWIRAEASDWSTEIYRASDWLIQALAAEIEQITSKPQTIIRSHSHCHVHTVRDISIILDFEPQPFNI